MDSGSTECVAPENIAKSIPLVETEASRQGQTYHTADGGVIKNNGGRGGERPLRCIRRPVTSISRGIRLQT